MINYDCSKIKKFLAISIVAGTAFFNPALEEIRVQDRFETTCFAAEQQDSIAQEEIKEEQEKMQKAIGDVLTEQYSLFYSKILDEKAEDIIKEGLNDTNITTLSNPISFTREISNSEKLIFEKQLEILGLKDDLKSFNSTNYTVILPGSNINKSKSTFDFINIMEFTIKKAGTRTVYFVTRGRIKHNGSIITEGTYNFVEYPLAGSNLEISRLVISKTPDGKLYGNIEKLDPDQYKIVPKEVKNTCKKIFTMLKDGLDKDEEIKATNMLMDMFGVLKKKASVIEE